MNYYSFFLCLSLLMFTACGNDEDNIDPQGATGDNIILAWPEDFNLEMDFQIEGNTIGARRIDETVEQTFSDIPLRQIRYQYDGDLPDGTYTLTVTLLSEPNNFGFNIFANTDAAYAGATFISNWDNTTNVIQTDLIIEGDNATFVF